MSTWLIIDANNLAWRSYHVMGDLKYNNVETGIVYGFLRNLSSLCERLRADHFVFCFDHGRGLRQVEHSDYKAARHNGLTREQIRDRTRASEQIDNLKFLYLPTLGFSNVLYQEGYEADDVIASVVLNLPAQDEAIIASSDHDLYQLLSGAVSIWNFKKLITLQSFYADWKLTPDKWVDVKAMAGCTSDGVVGIRGIGEKTAAKYLRGELKETSAAYRKIDAGRGIWHLNLDLVSLPYPGCQQFLVFPDDVNEEAWKELAEQLGMKSLLNLCPVRGRRRIPSK